MPKIGWTDDAIKDLQRLDNPIARRILNKITWLSHHFNNITPEPLSGKLVGSFKLRVGDWRVIYTIQTDELVIQAIGHRSEVYK